MKIKSLDELRKLRASLQDTLSLRKQGEHEDASIIEILVGMGTCGISAGARETMNELLKEINTHNLQNVKVLSTGCIGDCSMEPTVEVHIPNKEAIVYGKITKNRVKELVEKVIINNESFDENLVIKSYHKVGA